MGISGKNIYEFGPFRLHTTEHILLRDGQIVPLTPKVFETLVVLVENSGHVVDKDDLLKQVWSDTFVEEGNLTKNISILRKVLGETDSRGSAIETIPKRGYRFIAPVSEIRIEPLPGHVSRRSEMRQSRKFKIELGVGVALILLLTGLGYWYSRNGSSSPSTSKPIESVAVLPLENISGDPSQDYFADGMTDLLISELMKIEGLRVIARNSAMQYKGKQKAIAEIARELRVETVVQGTVLRSNDKVRISVQLFRALPEKSLWAENYERDLHDVLALQREVTLGIVNSIKVKLSLPERASLSHQNFTNREAQDSYLKGRFYWHQATYSNGSLEEIKSLYLKSFDYFQRAIDIEPNNAQAYAGLAQSYHWLGSMGFSEYHTKSKEAALTAIRLDEKNADAHAAYAWVLWRHEWKIEESEREMKRAIELNPNDSRHGYAMLLSSIGRHDEAIEAVETGEPLDPLDTAFKQNIAFIYLDARKYDIAERRFRDLVEIDASDSYSCHGLAATLAEQGRHQEAIDELQEAITRERVDSATDVRLATFYAKAERSNDAMKILEKVVMSSQSRTRAERIAGVYAVLGKKDQAFVWLERALARRSEGILYIKINPDFDSLRDDPRYKELLVRIGLPG